MGYTCELLLLPWRVHHYLNLEGDGLVFKSLLRQPRLGSIAMLNFMYGES